MGAAIKVEQASVLQRMKAHPQDWKEQKQGLAEMGSYTKRFNDVAAVGQLADQPQIIEVLVAAIQNHREIEEVAREASDALYVILQVRPELRATATAAGAVPSLVASLRRWHSTAAAFALAVLCLGSQQVQREALELGALDALRSAIKARPILRNDFAWCSFAVAQGDGAALLGLVSQQDDWMVRVLNSKQQDFNRHRTHFPTVAAEMDALVKLVDDEKHLAKVRRTARPPAAAGYPASLDGKAEAALREAITAGSIPELQQAIEEANKHEVNKEALLEAREVLQELREKALNSHVSLAAQAGKRLHEVGVRDDEKLKKRKTERAFEVQAELESKSDPKSIPSGHGSLIETSRPTPIGLQVCQACDEIYDFLQEPERSNADEQLENLCRKSKLSDASPDLKNSIFGLMEPQDIKSFLQAPDHRLWQQIKKNTEEFISLLKNPGAAVPYSVEEMTPKAKNPKVRNIRPVIMDQSVREPATNTPFGHTGYQKFLTLKIVKSMGFKDIAISGQYYGTSYTPETQILEWMKVKGEKMDGMIVMFAPGKGDRDAGIKAIKDFGIPNAFLDLTMKASVRFKQSDFVSSVLETVEILDQIFTDRGFKPNPWRTDEEVNKIPGEGEISVNLVDLMEFLDLKPDGKMNPQKKAEAEKAFRRWKSSDAFKRRVVGILTEEGRGVANYKDYGVLSKWLRKHFPQERQYRVLVHAHGGNGNTQDAASVEAVVNGANGVWAAVIPQAAQSGHNSSMVFLDNMLQMGNGHVLEDFWLHQGAQCARHIYSLNFNIYTFPDDCPIWGARVDQLLHTAFSTVSGEEWRQRRGKYYDIWGDDERGQISRMTKATDLHHTVAMLRSQSRVGNYRISPLVSDVETWRQRIVELGAAVVGPRERAGDHVKEVRDLGFALMNAGIRSNMNEPDTLKQLWDIATRNKTKNIRCDRVAAYLKARQHQGERE